MAASLVTLTTDFGARSPYVAAMKGALLLVNAAATLVDLSHSIPPQDLRYCSFFLRSAVPFFPSGTLHVVVVDPGVGTERAVLYVEIGGQRLLVPDNGCWTALTGASEGPSRVVRLTERRYWRADVSATFHGRDIFAPVAGHLSLGLDPERLGPRVATWVDLAWPRPHVSRDALDGEVVFVDDFGNLLTNITAQDLRSRPVRRVTVGGHAVDRLVRTYGEAPAGTVVALVSSADVLEVAEVQGSAAGRLGVTVGTPVRVEIGEAQPRVNGT
jgi:S-adenosylmethionine hydrolase